MGLEYSTWGTDTSAEIDIDVTLLIATANAGGWASCRGEVGVSSGKFYWEVTATTMTRFHFVGVGNDSATLGNYCGADANGWGINSSNGNKYTGGSALGYGVAFAQGDVISVALDMDSGKLYFAKNGTWMNSGDPAAGTGFAYSGLTGTLKPMWSKIDNGDQGTINVGQSAFAYPGSVPSGFTSGLYVIENDIIDLTNYPATINVTPSASLGITLDSIDAAINITPSADVFFGTLIDITSYPATVNITPSASLGVTLDSIEAAVNVTPTAPPRVVLPVTANIDVTPSVSEIKTFTLVNPIIRYYCTLTGSADATTDVELPMTSLQSRRRSGDPSYLEVVVPGTDYSAQIAARSNGELVIEMAFYQDGTLYQRQEIARVELETIRIDEGSTSESITLSGHKTVSYSAKTVALKDPTYTSDNGGKLLYRTATPNIYLNPGDTVTYGADSFTVDLVTYTISTTQQSMEVSEA